MRPQTSPTTHKARGRSQKYTFHPIILIVIMLTMTMIINGDHLHLSIILILSPLFIPPRPIPLPVSGGESNTHKPILFQSTWLRWWKITKMILMNMFIITPLSQILWHYHIIIMMMMVMMIADNEWLPTVRRRARRALTWFKSDQRPFSPQKQETSRISHQHHHSTPQRLYLNNVWWLA